jgi:predicted MPP superfamily phosphohydrolase
VLSSQPTGKLGNLTRRAERQVFLGMRHNQRDGAFAEFVMRTADADQLKALIPKPPHDPFAVPLHAHINTHLWCIGQRPVIPAKAGNQLEIVSEKHCNAQLTPAQPCPTFACKRKARFRGENDQQTLLWRQLAGAARACGQSMKALRRISTWLFLIFVSLGIWAFGIEPSLIRVKEYRLEVRNWPAALAGYKIAFITDPHVGGPHIGLRQVEKIVERTNALRPDLTLLGGDYVIRIIGGHDVAPEDIAAGFAKLSARHGVFGVLGNHDWWMKPDRIQSAFEKNGIPMLENKALQIPAKGDGFWLVGVSDFAEQKHDITKAFAPVTGRQPVILLTHSPDVFPELPLRAVLTLAGHTHGGQVYVPFLGRPVIPSIYGQLYAMGIIHENGKQLFVSPGIGTSILPVRFLTMPEISVLTLHPAPE